MHIVSQRPHAAARQVQRPYVMNIHRVRVRDREHRDACKLATLPLNDTKMMQKTG